jgi:putative MFS transporter
MDVAGTRASVDDIVARLERLPTSWWQVKARIIVGVATFFDAFDALAIASVLPVIVPLWKLTPPQIGLMISAGFLGQLLGALLFGWIAERYGRMTAMVWSIALFAVMSLVCALAWDYNSLLVLRTIQGIGLGGEVPVAAVFISELAKAQGRGRFVLLYELVFPIGLVAASLAGLWVVPHLGWQYMFVIGAIPAVLALLLRRLLPESPRWLASRGRDVEADRVLTRIEALVSANGARPLPPIPTGVPPAVAAIGRFRDLFAPAYLQRTLSLWVLWFCTYAITYAMTGWLPSIMRTIYHQPVSQSNLYGFILNIVGLCVLLTAVFTIDRIGRKRAFTVGFLLAAVPMLVAAFAPNLDAFGLAVLATLAFGLMGMIPGSLGMYTAENYPNHLRALGNGATSVSQRLSSVISPTLVGLILPSYGVGGVYGMFAVFAIVGGVTCALFSIETAGKTLEELSPSPAPAATA